jgi:hypothetical protein
LPDCQRDCANCANRVASLLPLDDSEQVLVADFRYSARGAARSSTLCAEAEDADVLADFRGLGAAK